MGCKKKGKILDFVLMLLGDAPHSEKHEKREKVCWICDNEYCDECKIKYEDGNAYCPHCHNAVK